MVRYAILGPIELCDGERRVAVGGSRQVALLALLLVNANRAVAGDRLIDAVWHDRAPAGALKRLQVAIARLRAVLDDNSAQSGSVLQTLSGGYLLAVHTGELDAEVFQTRVEHGRRTLAAGEPDHAREVMREALGMWRGPALAGVAYEEFAQAEIRRLEELRLAALEIRVECELQLGEHNALIGELEALLAAHPGRERLTAQLMLALYRCGRQGEALATYARTRAYLSCELGLEPGPLLRALQADILAQSPALQAADVALNAADGTTNGGSRILTGQIALPLPRSLRHPSDSPFVGRDAELARLLELWEGTCSGKRSTVTIGGEAGIGKTRLASELALAVHEDKGLTLYGRCDEGLAAPYQPFVEALQPYVRALGPDRLHAELGDLAPQLGRLVPGLAGLREPARGDPESDRFAVFEAVAALMEAMTRRQRALLILDDLHWAARPTLLLLRHLVRCDRPLRLLIVGSYRKTDLDAAHPLAQLLADLQRDAGTELLSMGGLGEPAIAALLEMAVGHPLDERASDMVQLLGDQTGGNPFFIRELLADLVESGTISPAAGVTAAQVDVPDGLRQVIGQRVARLSAPAQHTLRVAAVAGATFSFVLLERVLDEQSVVLDALDEAVAAGLLTEAGQDQYAFAHALVRQTIYEQLGAARRMRLHRQLGETLEALGDTDVHVEALAHHFAQAALDGQADKASKAADYALAAGHSATARLGYDEAAAHYERGLQALSQATRPQEQRRGKLLLALGQTRWSTGEPDNARRAFKQAADIADLTGDAAAAADAALGFSGPFFEIGARSARPGEALLQRALAMLHEQESALRARLLGRLAAARAHTGGQHDHRALAYDGLAMARRAQDKNALADVLATCYWATRGPDDPEHHLRMARELVGLAEHVGDARLLANGHAWVINHHLERGEMDAALGERDELQQLAQTRNDRYARWQLAAIHAMHSHIQGQLGRAESFAQEAIAQWADRPQFASPAQVFTAQMFALRREQGRLDELVELVADVVEQTPEVPAWRCALAHIYAHLGARDRARRELQLLGDLSRLPRDAFWLPSITMVATVTSFLHDHGRCRQAYELLLPHANTCLVALSLVCEGSMSRPLGMLATALGRYDDAERCFGRALEMNARIRSPLWIAHTKAEHARMLLRRNHPGDDDKALTLLAEALATAERLGLKALAEKVGTLKLDAQAAEHSLALSRSD